MLPYTYCNNLHLFYLLHFLGLDLHHVNVLPPIQRRAQLPTTRLVISTLTPDLSIPLVPPSLVQKIESGDNSDGIINNQLLNL